jgi:hypothetical protein
LQSRPNRRHCQIFLFRGDAAGLSVAIFYGAFKSYAPTRNLVTIIKSFLWWFLVELRFRARFWTKLPLWQISFSSNVESFSLKNLGDLPFDKVISRLFLVSRILAQSSKNLMALHHRISALHHTISIISQVRL